MCNIKALAAGKFMDIPELNNKTNINVGVRSLMISVFFALLAFFIMMNAISSADKQKTEDILRSLQSEFKNTDIKNELLVFDKRKYDESRGDHSKDFRELITTFLDAYKSTADTTLSESPALYIIKINMLSFFGPENNNPRPNAQNFLVALNNYLTLNKKKSFEQAKLVIMYNSNHADASEKLLGLAGLLKDEKEQNITFSLVDSSRTDPMSFNKIYIFFDKNEF